MITNIKNLRENIYYRQPLSDRKFNRLVDDIQRNGIKEPLFVEVDPRDPTKFMIIDGIQRFKVAQLIGITDIPITVYKGK